MVSKEEIKGTIKNYEGKRVPTTLSIKDSIKTAYRIFCIQKGIDISDGVEYLMLKQMEQENK